jgi:hypothetical protein
VTIPEHAVPYPRHGRMWDDTLTGIQRLRRVDFLLGLGLDPSRVPDGARIEHDGRTDEYRVQYIGPAGRLVWVRRLWFPRPAGPRQFGPITEALAGLRDAYAYPYGNRGLPEPEPAVFDRARWEATRAAFVAQLPARRPVIEDPMRVFPSARRGLSADVTIIDDPIMPGRAFDPALAAAALERVGYMRARGA